MPYPTIPDPDPEEDDYRDSLWGIPSPLPIGAFVAPFPTPEMIIGGYNCYSCSKNVLEDGTFLSVDKYVFHFECFFSELKKEKLIFELLRED